MAHNGRRFDLPFLAAELARNELQLPGSWRYLDTLELAKLVLPKQLHNGVSHSQVCTLPLGLISQRGFTLLNLVALSG